MFPGRYFASRYFPTRYFCKVGVSVGITGNINLNYYLTLGSTGIVYFNLRELLYLRRFLNDPRASS